KSWAAIILTPAIQDQSAPTPASACFSFGGRATAESAEPDVWNFPRVFLTSSSSSTAIAESLSRSDWNCFQQSDPILPTTCYCTSRQKGIHRSSAFLPAGRSVTKRCRFKERAETVRNPCFSMRPRLRVIVVGSIARVFARTPIATGSDLAIPTRIVKLAEPRPARCIAASYKLVTVRAALRMLNDAQYPVPARSSCGCLAFMSKPLNCTYKSCYTLTGQNGSLCRRKSVFFLSILQRFRPRRFSYWNCPTIGDHL